MREYSLFFLNAKGWEWAPVICLNSTGIIWAAHLAFEIQNTQEISKDLLKSPLHICLELSAG